MVTRPRRGGHVVQVRMAIYTLAAKVAA